VLYRNKEWLKGQLDAGKNGTLIANEIGAPPCIVNRWIKRFSIRIEKKYKDKDWLADQLAKGKSGLQISKELGVANSIIYKWMQKYGLETIEVNPPLYKSKDWLETEYIVKDRSVEDIAEELSVYDVLIYKWLRRHGIPTKRSTTPFKQQKNAIYKNEDWLHEEFVVKRRTSEDIAKPFDVDRKAVEWYIKKYDLERENLNFGRIPESKLPSVRITCSACGKKKEQKGTYYARRLRAGKDTYFCNRECADRHHSQQMTGENNPNFEGSFHGPKDAYLMSLKVNTEIGRIGNTSIERAIQTKLDELGIRYEPQKQMYYWQVDFYLPDHNLVIETHGDYWHGNPEVYNDCNLNHTQIKNRNRDKSKAAYLAKNGHRVLILWEKDIKMCINWCVNRIKEVLEP
jgi:G:T-mismatch repair DNA endonuclease (very short patch repair protein)/transposase